jgi:uncharacterized low-complexity protein
MLKYITAAAAAAMIMAPTLAGAATLGPASTMRDALAGASLIEQVQHCQCGRVCARTDYYGQCVSWRCRACYAPPRYAPPRYAPPRYDRY